MYYYNDNRLKPYTIHVDKRTDTLGVGKLVIKVQFAQCGFVNMYMCQNELHTCLLHIGKVFNTLICEMKAFGSEIDIDRGA